jgi:hypothetical protein
MLAIFSDVYDDVLVDINIDDSSEEQDEHASIIEDLEYPRLDLTQSVDTVINNRYQHEHTFKDISKSFL